MAAEARRYVFAPLEHRGVIAGLGGAQIGLLGGGLLVATVLLRAVPDAVGVCGAVAVVLAATGLAFAPVGGRQVDEWVPTGARRVIRVARGVHRTRATGGERVLRTPSAFAGLRFEELEQPADPPVGVVCDQRAATLTAVLAVRGRSFALLDGADKERRLGAWSSVLAGLSREGSPVRALQWVERTVPGDADDLTRHFEAARAMPAESAVARSYAALVAEAGPLGQEHECFVALTVRMRRRRGTTSPRDALLRELRLLHGQL
ncbi:MAG: SCO6880 family protein, partial [Acidimicrobiales bacterium]